ncbi:hypothetical protein GIB67_031955 [Kingdonia uniflora]|uniref:Uncharacterized protein n=1 Tax=Kingdonia uniflora TaxID=39325 RepID=A0A7J7NTL5_9MAGN|nr:hypothetical protein GIB67_031955 [Kingdonia uniflora]
MNSNKYIYKYTSCKRVLTYTPVTRTTNYTLITTVTLSAMRNQSTSEIPSHTRVNNPQPTTNQPGYPNPNQAPSQSYHKLNEIAHN